MKTINIKGKEYVEVNERLLYFRENYKDWSLISEIVSMENDKDLYYIVVMKASIIDDKGVVRATGHAYEKEGSTFINKTSYIENCETSAWGRALANLGIGITSSVASADEVGNAIANQSFDRDEKVGRGKHSDIKWSEVPDDYLVWASQNASGNLKDFAQKELDHRMETETDHYRIFKEQMKGIYKTLGNDGFFEKLSDLGYENIMELENAESKELDRIIKAML